MWSKISWKWKNMINHKNIENIHEKKFRDFETSEFACTENSGFVYYFPSDHISHKWHHNYDPLYFLLIDAANETHSGFSARFGPPRNRKDYILELISTQIKRKLVASENRLLLFRTSHLFAICDICLERKVQSSPCMQTHSFQNHGTFSHGCFLYFCVSGRSQWVQN